MDNISGKTIGEVFKELEELLKGNNLLPSEYFDLGIDIVDGIPKTISEKEPFPEDYLVKSYCTWGGNEGIYLDIQIEAYNKETKTSRIIPFAVGKTLDESSEAYDRMNYIAGFCYKALTSFGFSVNNCFLKDFSMINLERKLNAEFKNFLKEKLLFEQSAPSRYADVLAQMSIVLGLVSRRAYFGLSDKELARAYSAKNTFRELFLLVYHRDFFSEEDK